MQMVARKEKQFLIFTLNDNKEVKYDLSTGKTYGKSGKEVKSIASQLQGYSITDLIKCFPDENYRNFLSFLNTNFVNYKKPTNWWSNSSVGTRVKNIGTFLSKINQYRFYEQYFSAGVTKISRDFTIKMAELPKGYLKYARTYNITIDTLSVKTYECFSNTFGEIERIVNRYEILTRTDLTSMLIPRTQLVRNKDTGNRDQISIIESNSYLGNKDHQNFEKLINTYSYNKMSLLQYIDNIMYFEGVAPLSTLLNELVDYNRMQSEMSIHKYEKYPKNFLTTHTITCRNYNRLTATYPVESFEERVDKELEFKTKDYIFIYPNTPQDIKDEAVMQTNCVASYIDKVINGSCHIMFLRKKEEPNQSLVTLEIKNYKVVQSRRAFNKDPLPEEHEAIKQFNQYLAKLQKKRFQEQIKVNEQFFKNTYIAPQKMVKK